MKPAPPVIMMFFTSGRGSNLVVPCRRGARRQTSMSGKSCEVRCAATWPYVPGVYSRRPGGLCVCEGLISGRCPSLLSDIASDAFGTLDTGLIRGGQRDIMCPAQIPPSSGGVARQHATARMRWRRWVWPNVQTCVCERVFKPVLSALSAQLLMVWRRTGEHWGVFEAISTIHHRPFPVDL